MKILPYEKALLIGKINRRPKAYINCIIEYENSKYLYICRPIARKDQSRREIINKKTFRREIDDVPMES